MDALGVDISFYVFDGGRREVQPFDGTKVHIAFTSLDRVLEGERFEVVSVSDSGLGLRVKLGFGDAADKRTRMKNFKCQFCFCQIGTS